MTDEERQAYNVQAYNKFREAGAGLNRNECELCGFVPYTKNKYREKQDHLAKFHFKERIDAVLPTGRPYACPADECEYLGKDKQDILRHYTGKHNILKVDGTTLAQHHTETLLIRTKRNWFYILIKELSKVAVMSCHTAQDVGGGLYVGAERGGSRAGQQVDGPDGESDRSGEKAGVEPHLPADGGAGHPKRT